jgi:hypothetical protein
MITKAGAAHKNADDGDCLTEQAAKPLTAV